MASCSFLPAVGRGSSSVWPTVVVAIAIAVAGADAAYRHLTDPAAFQSGNVAEDAFSVTLTNVATTGAYGVLCDSSTNRYEISNALIDVSQPTGGADATLYGILIVANMTATAGLYLRLTNVTILVAGSNAVDTTVGYHLRGLEVRGNFDSIDMILTDVRIVVTEDLIGGGIPKTSTFGIQIQDTVTAGGAGPFSTVMERVSISATGSSKGAIAARIVACAPGGQAFSTRIEDSNITVVDSSVVLGSPTLTPSFYGVVSECPFDVSHSNTLVTRLVNTTIDVPSGFGVAAFGPGEMHVESSTVTATGAQSAAVIAHKKLDRMPMVRIFRSTLSAICPTSVPSNATVMALTVQYDMPIAVERPVVVEDSNLTAVVQGGPSNHLAVGLRLIVFNETGNGAGLSRQLNMTGARVHASGGHKVYGLHVAGQTRVEGSVSNTLLATFSPESGDDGVVAGLFLTQGSYDFNVSDSKIVSVGGPRTRAVEYSDSVSSSVARDATATSVNLVRTLIAAFANFSHATFDAAFDADPSRKAVGVLLMPGMSTQPLSFKVQDCVLRVSGGASASDYGGQQPPGSGSVEGIVVQPAPLATSRLLLSTSSIHVTQTQPPTDATFGLDDTDAWLPLPIRLWQPRHDSTNVHSNTLRSLGSPFSAAFWVLSSAAQLATGVRLRGTINCSVVVEHVSSLRASAFGSVSVIPTNVRAANFIATSATLLPAAVLVWNVASAIQDRRYDPGAGTVPTFSPLSTLTVANVMLESCAVDTLANIEFHSPTAGGFEIVSQRPVGTASVRFAATLFISTTFGAKPALMLSQELTATITSVGSIAAGQQLAPDERAVALTLSDLPLPASTVGNSIRLTVTETTAAPNGPPIVVAPAFFLQSVGGSAVAQMTLSNPTVTVTGFAIAALIAAPQRLANEAWNVVATGATLTSSGAGSVCAIALAASADETARESALGIDDTMPVSVTFSSSTVDCECINGASLLLEKIHLATSTVDVSSDVLSAGSGAASRRVAIGTKHGAPVTLFKSRVNVSYAASLAGTRPADLVVVGVPLGAVEPPNVTVAATPSPSTVTLATLIARGPTAADGGTCVMVRVSSDIAQLAGDSSTFTMSGGSHLTAVGSAWAADRSRDGHHAVAWSTDVGMDFMPNRVSSERYRISAFDGTTPASASATPRSFAVTLNNPRVHVTPLDPSDSVVGAIDFAAVRGIGNMRGSVTMLGANITAELVDGNHSTATLCSAVRIVSSSQMRVSVTDTLMTVRGHQKATVTVDGSLVSLTTVTDTTPATPPSSISSNTILFEGQGGFVVADVSAATIPRSSGLSLSMSVTGNVFVATPADVPDTFPAHTAGFSVGLLSANHNGSGSASFVTTSNAVQVASKMSDRHLVIRQPLRDAFVARLSVHGTSTTELSMSDSGNAGFSATQRYAAAVAEAIRRRRGASYQINTMTVNATTGNFTDMARATAIDYETTDGIAYVRVDASSATGSDVPNVAIILDDVSARLDMASSAIPSNRRYNREVSVVDTRLAAAAGNVAVVLRRVDALLIQRNTSLVGMNTFVYGVALPTSTVSAIALEIDNCTLTAVAPSQLSDFSTMYVRFIDSADTHVTNATIIRSAFVTTVDAFTIYSAFSSSGLFMVAQEVTLLSLMGLPLRGPSVVTFSENRVQLSGSHHVRTSRVSLAAASAATESFTFTAQGNRITMDGTAEPSQVAFFVESNRADHALSSVAAGTVQGVRQFIFRSNVIDVACHSSYGTALSVPADTLPSGLNQSVTVHDIRLADAVADVVEFAENNVTTRGAATTNFIAGHFGSLDARRLPAHTPASVLSTLSFNVVLTRNFFDYQRPPERAEVTVSSLNGTLRSGYVVGCLASVRLLLPHRQASFMSTANTLRLSERIIDTAAWAGGAAVEIAFGNTMSFSGDSVVVSVGNAGWGRRSVFQRTTTGQNASIVALLGYVSIVADGSGALSPGTPPSVVCGYDALGNWTLPATTDAAMTATAAAMQPFVASEARWAHRAVSDAAAQGARRASLLALGRHAGWDRDCTPMPHRATQQTVLSVSDCAIHNLPDLNMTAHGRADLGVTIASGQFMMVRAYSLLSLRNGVRVQVLRCLIRSLTTVSSIAMMHVLGLAEVSVDGASTVSVLDSHVGVLDGQGVDPAKGILYSRFAGVDPDDSRLPLHMSLHVVLWEPSGGGSTFHVDGASAIVVANCSMATAVGTNNGACGVVSFGRRRRGSKAPPAAAGEVSLGAQSTLLLADNSGQCSGSFDEELSVQQDIRFTVGPNAVVAVVGSSMNFTAVRTSGSEICSAIGPLSNASILDGAAIVVLHANVRCPGSVPPHHERGPFLVSALMAGGNLTAAPGRSSVVAVSHSVFASGMAGEAERLGACSPGWLVQSRGSSSLPPVQQTSSLFVDSNEIMAAPMGRVAVTAYGDANSHIPFGFVSVRNNTVDAIMSHAASLLLGRLLPGTAAPTVLAVRNNTLSLGSLTQSSGFPGTVGVFVDPDVGPTAVRLVVDDVRFTGFLEIFRIPVHGVNDHVPAIISLNATAGHPTTATKPTVDAQVNVSGVHTTLHVWRGPLLELGAVALTTASRVRLENNRVVASQRGLSKVGTSLLRLSRTVIPHGATVTSFKNDMSIIAERFQQAALMSCLSCSIAPAAVPSSSMPTTVTSFNDTFTVQLFDPLLEPGDFAAVAASEDSAVLRASLQHLRMTVNASELNDFPVDVSLVMAPETSVVAIDAEHPRFLIHRRPHSQAATLRINIEHDGLVPLDRLSTHVTCPTWEVFRANVSHRTHYRPTDATRASVDFCQRSGSQTRSLSPTVTKTYVPPPAKPIPRGQLTPETVTAAEATQTVAVTMSGGLGTPTSATQATRSTALLKLSRCTPSFEELDFGDHPTAVAIGDERTKHHLGAVVMNLVLVLAWVAVNGFVGLARAAGTAEKVTHALAWARFPSACVFPAMFFVQPLTTSSIACIAFGSGATVLAGVVGLLTVIVMIMAVLYFFKFVLRRTAVYDRVDDGSDETRKAAEKEKSVAEKLFGRDGEWQNLDPDRLDTGRHFGALFDDYNERAPWFAAAELIVSALLGFAMAIVQVGGCGGVAYAAVALYVGYMALLIYFRPHARRFDFGFTLLVGAAQLVVAGLIVIQTNGSGEDDSLDLAIESVTVATMFLMVVRAGYDAVITVRDLCFTEIKAASARQRRFTSAEQALINTEEGLGAADAVAATLDDLDVDDVAAAAVAPPPQPQPARHTPHRVVDTEAVSKPPPGIDYNVRMPDAFYSSATPAVYAQGARPLLDMEIRRPSAATKRGSDATVAPPPVTNDSLAALLDDPPPTSTVGGSALRRQPSASNTKSAAVDDEDDLMDLL